MKTEEVSEVLESCSGDICEVNKDVCELEPNKAVSLFMIHSYIYYVLGTAVISDLEWDNLCLYLSENIDKSNHMHKRFITGDSLNSGSGFGITKYPTIVKVCAIEVLKGGGL